MSEKTTYPAHERRLLFFLLIAATGYFGAYTYVARGGIFANAQSLNFVLLAIRLSEADFAAAARLLCPITAFFIGTLLSALPNPKERPQKSLSFASVLVLFVMLTSIVIAVLPPSFPNLAVQTTVSFLSALLFNTFRQNEGLPMATTFVTAHFRETSAALCDLIQKKENGAKRRLMLHGAMLLFFFGGAFLSALLSRFFKTYALLGVLPFLIAAFILLLREDLNRS